jgi:hypothetical protein
MKGTTAMFFDHKRDGTKNNDDKKEELNNLLNHLPIELHEPVKRLGLEDGKLHFFEQLPPDATADAIYINLWSEGKMFGNMEFKLEPLKNGEGTSLLWVHRKGEGSTVDAKSIEYQFCNGTLTSIASNLVTTNNESNEINRQSGNINDSDPRFTLEARAGTIEDLIRHGLGKMVSLLEDKAWNATNAPAAAPEAPPAPMPEAPSTPMPESPRKKK